MNNKKEIFNWILLSSISTIILFVLLILFYDMPGSSDVRQFEMWIDNAVQHGLKTGFQMNADMYPPYSTFILFCFAKIMDTFSYLHIVRIALFCFCALSVAVFDFLYKEHMISGILFISLLTSFYMGYLDILFLPFLLLSFFFWDKKKYILFAVAFSFCCLIKFQAVIIAPFMLFYFFSIKEKKFHVEWSKIIKIGCSSVTIIMLTLAIYGSELIKTLKVALFQSTFLLSGNALNFPWLVQWASEYFFPEKYIPLGIDGRIAINWEAPIELTFSKYIFYIVLLALLIVILVVPHEKRDTKLLIKMSLIGYSAYFMFSLGAHENHLFVGMILAFLLLVYEKNRINYFIMIAFSLMYNFNLLIFYIIPESIIKRVVLGIDITVPMALFNVICFSMIAIYEVAGAVRLCKSRDIIQKKDS